MKKKELQQDANQGYALQRRRILHENSNFYVQEAYRTLRTNILFSLPGDGGKCVAITSTNPHEGKSINSLNIAISFAQAGNRVLLVDTDMRRPTLARLLVEKATPGLSNVLAGQATAEKAIRRGVYENLDVLLSGDIPPNPTELLGSAAMEQVLQQQKENYDFIIIDTPPVGVVSDVCVLAKSLDGVLFLVWQGRTEKDALAQSIRQLEMSGIKLLGFILNDVESSSKKYGYKKGYAYSYSYSYAHTKKGKKGAHNDAE